MTAANLLLAIVLPPWLGAVFVVLFGLRRVRVARAIVLAALSVSLAAAALALVHCAHGHELVYRFGGWAAPFGIVYRVDGLGALMALLVSGISLAVLVYAGPTLRREVPGQESPFYATSSLFVAGLCGMVLTGDLFNLYVFLEIASLTAYTLIAAGEEPASLASFRYLLIGTVGASFYLIGLAYLFSLTGTLNMADMAARLPVTDAPLAVAVATAFIVTGFGLKMAMFPMFGWLPDAYTFAPSAATALIGALMTKVAAFALLRILYGVLWPTLAALDLPITGVVGGAGAAAILLGSAMALAQHDMKRLLAYSSIAHLGYIALGLSLGNRNGLTGAMLHIVAHAIAKGCLFLVVGGVAYRFGTRLDGVLERAGREMPVSMGALAVAALSMIGVPPTVGFFSKWYLILGSIDAGQPLFVAVLLASSLLNAWYFFRWIERIYFARHAEVAQQAPAGGPELPRAMLAPIIGLAWAVVLVGLLSAPLVRDVVRPALPDTAVALIEPQARAGGEAHHARR